jgi:hypothetical protein
MVFPPIGYGFYSPELISLWDMLYKFVHIFRAAIEELQDIRMAFIILKEPKQLTQDLDSRLRANLDFVSKLSKSIALEATNHLAGDLVADLDSKISSLGIDEIDAKLDSIQVMLRKELEDRKFFYVPPERASYYNNKDVCGIAVAEMFPDAVADAIETGNCYALHRPTACVFHLMRVIPYGMAALAKNLKVKYSQPIECLEWGSIIQPIEKAVSKLQQLSRSPKKLRDQQYYAEIVQHLYFCKDAWRNHVSHAREPYDMPQAKSVMDHVTLVMQLVADRLKKPFKLRR